MRDAWRLAAGTFLAVPVPPPRRVDRTVAGRAMLLAPATAVPAALAWLALSFAVGRGWLPSALAAALALCATALASRAMHLDGLADTADGLTSGYDRDRALEVMRRGDTGPAGAAALVLTLLVQWAALAALLGTPTTGLLAAVALVASRLAPAVSCRRGVPAARPEGLGATVAESVSPGWLVAVVVALAAAASLAAWPLHLPPYAAGLVTLSAAAGAWLVSARARSRLGGVTGDTLGAGVEVALAVALTVATVVAAAHGAR